MKNSPHDKLRNLPSIDRLLNIDGMAGLVQAHGRPLMAQIARKALAQARRRIMDAANPHAEPENDDEWVATIKKLTERETAPRLRRVINCSGVVVHSNLGRGALAESAVNAMVTSALSGVNLEYNVETGARGDRDNIVEDLLTELTGAESATVVNNNSAAVLLTLNTLAQGKEAIVSRGELIEIGGSFRLPDVMEKSACVLREVGTTNRTSLADYENAMGEQTALCLQVHTSNYKIVGYTAKPQLKDLADLSKAKGLPVVVDLGSGALLDMRMFGAPDEPTAREIIGQGADIVTMSGDKLLGGPQAGIILGASNLVDRIRNNPLKRALRCGKTTISALEATLQLYRWPEKAAEQIPTLRHLARPVEQIREIALQAVPVLEQSLGAGAEVFVIDDISRAGSGAMPQVDIPTVSVAIRRDGMRPDQLAEWFRKLDPPIIGRVADDLFRLDMRTIYDPEDIRPKP